MINDIRKDCITFASYLGDYQKISTDELANKYCEALDTKNEWNKSTYMAALVLRFWYRIEKLYQANLNTGLEREDFFSWLVESINYACKYRAWQTKEVNAQQAINQCIETIRHQHYYEFNLDKHRANYNTVSFATPVSNTKNKENSNEASLLDTLEYEDEEQIYDEGAYTAAGIIQSFIENKKIIEAIILDNIAFNDVQKKTKKTVKYIDSETGKTERYVEHYSEFWSYKLIQILSKLPSEYQTSFLKRYKIKEPEFQAAFGKIQSASNQKLYKYVKACLADCAKNPIFKN